jgi:hypothetical protein
MDPVEVYKRYIKIEKPDLQVITNDGDFFIYSTKYELCGPIERDPTFVSIRDCCERRAKNPEATLFICRCKICEKALLYDLSKLLYEKK